MPRAIRSKHEGDPLVFRALAHATRRAILRELGAGELRASDIAAKFTISRPAISRHLRVLREARLVRARPVGREKFYSIVPRKLRKAAAHVLELDSFWSDALTRLGDRTRRGE